jgi:hypothetical protein
MDAALDRLRAEGHPVRDEDVARLSPLGFEHINMLGRYAFTLPEESGKNLGLRGCSGEWVMEAAVEDGDADLKHAVCAAR